MKSFYMLLLFLFPISVQVFGSSTPKEKTQELRDNGVTIMDNTKTYTDYQYHLLSTFDFNAYRNYSTKRIAQIEDGPLVELSSIAEMQQSGKEIPAEFTEKKNNEVTQKNLKGIITLINIGFRYGPKKNTETGF